MGRRVGTLALMALVVVVAMGLALSLRHDVGYFFAPATVTDLGDIQRLDPAHLSTNTFVRVSGMPTAASAVRYRRVVTGESYEVFPLAGQRAVFVHVPASAAMAGRTEFSGRLVTFGQLGGRMRPIREYFEHQMGMPVTAESFVLLADESPPSYWWALFFALLCAAIVAFDVYLVLRWFRPVAEPSEAEDAIDDAG